MLLGAICEAPRDSRLAPRESRGTKRGFWEPAGKRVCLYALCVVSHEDCAVLHEVCGELPARCVCSPALCGVSHEERGELNELLVERHGLNIGAPAGTVEVATACEKQYVVIS